MNEERDEHCADCALGLDCANNNLRLLRFLVTQLPISWQCEYYGRIIVPKMLEAYLFKYQGSLGETSFSKTLLTLPNLTLSMLLTELQQWPHSMIALDDD